MPDYSHLDLDALRSLKKTVGDHAAKAIQAEIDGRPPEEDGAAPKRIRSKRPSGPDPIFMVVMEEKGHVPEVEYHFHPDRKWRFDYAWPEQKLAVEVEGGVFAAEGSRHTRGAGFRKDTEKYNTATTMGWRVLRVLPEDLVSIQTLDMVMTILEGGEADE